MIATTRQYLALAFCAASAATFLVPTSYAVPSSQATAAAPGAISRRIGAVKAISGTAITLTPDSGPDVNVTVQPTTRVVRIAPGEKDLKNATPVQLQDVQVGDRILVGGKLSEDNLSLAASSVVVMKRSDLQARDQTNLQDWQKAWSGWAGQCRGCSRWDCHPVCARQEHYYSHLECHCHSPLPTRLGEV